MKHINIFDFRCAFHFFIFILFINDTKAQENTTKGLSPEVMSWEISTMEPWPPDKYQSLKDAMIDNNLYIQFIFRGGLFPKFEYTFNIDSLRLTDAAPIPSPFDFLRKRLPPMFKQYEFKKSLDDMVYRNVFLADPNKFKYSIFLLPEKMPNLTSILVKSTQDIKVDVEASVPPPPSIDPVIKFIPDRKYWTSSFAADIKFSQNKSSANWYKGEINNLNIYTNTITSYNYEKNSVSLSNTLTTTFTINNAPNDMLRKYTVGNDELRFRSNFGLKAIKNWSYSSSAEFITSMGNKYITNSQDKNSAFLSPFTVNAGIGMTYALKPKFEKSDHSLDLSLSLEPLAFKYMYSKDKTINLPAYFEKDGDGNYYHSMRTFGSTITMTQTVKFGKNVLHTRFYYFTNYERIIGELENKLDIALSRFFSTTFYLYLRYDDGVAKKEGSDTYLQINELFSFGFSYRW